MRVVHPICAGMDVHKEDVKGGSFIPAREIRDLRDMTRYRRRLIEERTAEVNRVQKILEDANIKLGCDVSRQPRERRKAQELQDSKGQATRSDSSRSQHCGGNILHSS